MAIEPPGDAAETMHGTRPVPAASRGPADDERTRQSAVEVRPTGPLAVQDAPTRRTPIRGLEEIELSSSSDSVGTPHSMDPAHVLRHRGFAWQRWAAGLILLLAVAIVSALLARRTAPGAAATGIATTGASPTAGGGGQPAATRATPASSETTTPEPAATPPPAARTGAAGAPETDTVGAAAPATLGVDSTADTASTPASANEEPAAAEPPPPPPPAYLVLPRAWNGAIVARVEGHSYRLDRERRVEVAPGEHRIELTLADGDYRDQATVTTSVEAGGSARLPVAIAEPGTLRIQPWLNSPRGEVTLDGAPVALVPTELRLKPGTHHLRAEREGSSPIEQDVEIASGQQTTASFDLARGRWLVANRPDAG